MVAAGFIEEVRGLAARGYSLDSKALRSVGYTQMAQVVRGSLSVDAAREEMKQETRRLAKRQLTWFRGDKDIRWFHPKQAAEIFTATKGFFSNR
jgi:tRNA dimethylallyltransferase